MGNFIGGLIGLIIIGAYWLGLVGVVLMGLNYLFN